MLVTRRQLWRSADLARDSSGRSIPLSGMLRSASRAVSASIHFLLWSDGTVSHRELRVVCSRPSGGDLKSPRLLDPRVLLDMARRWALPIQPFDSQPKHGGGLSLTAFPLVDHGLTGRADLGGKLLLAEAEPEPQTHERGRVVRRYGHAAHGDGTTYAATIGLAVPGRRESCDGLSCGGSGELPKVGSRAERRREPPVTRCDAQCPNMNVEFIG